MAGQDDEIFELDNTSPDSEEPGGTAPVPQDRTEALPAEDRHTITPLTGMYQDWFLDYASYVILERAVPHLDDGLKPVQRRLLHSMRRMEDGRYNKVANIIGHTMQFHPHGDASIGDALVNLGQKELLVDTQGNWGNIYTGDSAAAPRYIEARLSAFALDVVFNPKTTEWKLSYDGRNKEPVTLPVKFPLLLTQGVEGIAVGLASKIMPHNFVEVIQASIACLKGESFELYPDFPTGGAVDVSRYNDGIRGGAIRVRAHIVKQDKKTLVIKDIPFGKTTQGVIDSILKANEKGKIKIRKVDDNTAANVEIVIYLSPDKDISPDKTIDALYAFTDCEISISPNACVISENKPLFLSVTEMLRRSTQRTRELLGRELEIRMTELEEDWHYSSLEKIFFEKRIYRELERDSADWDAQIDAIEKALDPYRPLFRREILRDDILKLTEKPVRRISKFDIKKATEHILGLETQMEQVRFHLAHLTEYAIAYFEDILSKYGKGRERKTEIRSFDTIEATKVVIANEKLYVNWEEGFVGFGLRKDQYLCDCSDLDDIIAIRRDGSYVITKVSEKAFLGKGLMYVNVFQRNDSRTIYNIVYRDGKNGATLMKRCAITGVTRDKEYNLTKGTAGTTILYFSANPNGEAEILRVTLKPRARMRNVHLEVNLAELAIKGRDARGNMVTRYPVHRIALKEKGSSTLGGTPIWFDADVNRLNADKRGMLLGEFSGDDKILVVTENGLFRTTGFDLSQHFEDNILLIEPFDDQKVFTAVYFDPEKKFYYLKRFPFEQATSLGSFLSGEAGASLICLSGEERPRFRISYGGVFAGKPADIISAEDFIGVKSLRAKGKRLSTMEIVSIEEIEPLEPVQPREAPEPETVSGESPPEDAPENNLAIGSDSVPEPISEAPEAVPGSVPDKFPEVKFDIHPGKAEQMSLDL